MQTSALRLAAATALLAAFGTTAHAQVTGALGTPFGSILTLSGPGACTALTPCTLGPGAGTFVGGFTRNATVSGVAHMPIGTVGNFLSAGPSNNGTATLTFAQGVVGVGFQWGSPDSYNRLRIYTSDMAVTDFFRESVGLTTWTSEGYVRFTATHGRLITKMEFESSSNAFEVSNFTTTVPEPSTYLMMATGLLALGVVSRRRRTA